MLAGYIHPGEADTEVIASQCPSLHDQQAGAEEYSKAMADRNARQAELSNNLISAA